jgi:hypothetical protein
MLEDALSKAKIGEKDKMHAIGNLKKLAEKLGEVGSLKTSVR